jgi:hypothetical protein
VTDKSWKAFERRVARIIGGKRNPVTGERAGADVESDLLVGQLKLGYRLPGYLSKWLDGMTTWQAANAPEKVPVVIWKPKYAQDKDAVVVMRLSELTRILEGEC